MADYVNLPEEIHREILLTQSPANIIHHCNVNKNTYKICDNDLFWLDYLKGMKEYEIKKFVLDHVRQSQYFIIPIYKVASKLIRDYREENITDYILFYSIMRDDSAIIKYLLPRNYEINLSVIRRNCNKIIDIINSGDADATKIGRLCHEISEQLSTSEIPVTPILDQCKKGAINKLPAILMRDEEDENIGYYEDLVMGFVNILAEDVDLKSLMNIVQKAYDNKAPIKHLYHIIASCLPTSIFDYGELILPEKVNLGKYISWIKDLDHANYLMRHYSFIKPQHMIDLTRFIKPHDFVNEIYYATRRSPEGDELVKRIITRNTPRSADEAGNVKWAREVDKKWKEIKKSSE